MRHSLPAAVAEGFEVGLVIDNASRDDTAAVAERHGVGRFELARRVPYTEAMNAGLRQIIGRVDAVALLTGDTFLTPGYREACVGALADRGVASVAPKLLRTLGPEPPARIEVVDAAGMSLDRRRKNGLVGHGAPAAAFSHPGPAFGADGAAAFWRADALEDCAIDGDWFDENLGSWASDADLAWRAQLLGWRTAYRPDAVVHHIRRYSPTTRPEMPAADRCTQFRNRLLMIAKNDRLSDLRRDWWPLASYEVLALGYALLRERELLGGYVEAWRRWPEARRQRRVVQAKRRVDRVPFGLAPPG